MCLLLVISIYKLPLRAWRLMFVESAHDVGRRGGSQEATKTGSKSVCDNATNQALSVNLLKCPKTRRSRLITWLKRRTRTNRDSTRLALPDCVRNSPYSTGFHLVGLVPWSSLSSAKVTKDIFPFGPVCRYGELAVVVGVGCLAAVFTTTPNPGKFVTELVTLACVCFSMPC